MTLSDQNTVRTTIRLNWQGKQFEGSFHMDDYNGMTLEDAALEVHSHGWKRITDEPTAWRFSKVKSGYRYELHLCV